jgi:hypothetical protein
VPISTREFLDVAAGEDTYAYTSSYRYLIQ